MTTRADKFLVERGYAASRAEAQAAIRAGNVWAGGILVGKSSQTIAADAVITYEKSHPYVSRGALKLVAALDRFGLSPSRSTCIDVGASTGGFTQALLERGAAKVYAVDVGHGQMRGALTSDPRVIMLEGVNARDLGVVHVPEEVDAIVVDVSFISLKLVLPAVLSLARSGAWLVVLVKPQFEVGRENVGKGGIVKNRPVQEKAVREIVDWLGAQRGWTVEGQMDSPVAGGDGNREFLVAARKA